MRLVRRQQPLHTAGQVVPPVLLLLLSAGLRFYDLGYRSLWLDEVATAQAVRFPDPGTVLTYVARDPSATPLMYLVTWFVRPLGLDEWAIRFSVCNRGLWCCLTPIAPVAIERAAELTWERRADRHAAVYADLVIQ